MTGLRTPFLAAVLFTSVAAVGLTSALAQTASTPADTGAAASDAHRHAKARMMPGKFIDGRIAFLKAELKVTPAQETQWQQVEAAMRENAKSARPDDGDRAENRAGMNAI